MGKRIIMCLSIACMLALGGCGQANTGTDISQHNENIQADASNSLSEFEENTDDSTALDNSSEQSATCKNTWC